MKIVTVHQPNYLPYLGFFEKMARADLFILYDNTQYKSNDFQNRNRIRTNTSQGWIWLTVPVTYEFGTLIKDIKIADQHWRKTHWKSIEFNYSKAPFFNMYKDEFKKIYERDWTNLCDLNIALITLIRDILGIKTKLIRASELINKLESKSTQALVDLCTLSCATMYISGADGEKYLELEKFEKNGIKVEFQHYVHPLYNQAFPGFHPYMCALDLIFNYGSESLNIICS